MDKGEWKYQPEDDDYWESWKHPSGCMVVIREGVIIAAPTGCTAQTEIPGFTNIEAAMLAALIARGGSS